MRTKKLITALAGGAALVLALAGCSGSGSGSDDAASEAPYTVEKDVSLTGSPTFDKITKAGKVTIGVKEDQPGLGYLDAVTEERTGFDIDIARWMAASLGYSEDQIEFEAIPSQNRESALVNGDIDFYVGTYSITDERKKQIDFAGPYFETGQGLLVLKDNSDISSEKDLAGKTVCSVTGSTPIQNIRDNFPDTKTTEYSTYSECVNQMIDGQVDAVTTDQAILIGYASAQPDQLKVVGEPFTVEKYGIGLPKGDDALREYFNTTLTDGGETWKAIYDATLGQSGTEVEQPAVDNY